MDWNKRSYAGENDIAALFASIRNTPLQSRAQFREFCAKLHAYFPSLLGDRL